MIFLLFFTYIIGAIIAINVGSKSDGVDINKYKEKSIKTLIVMSIIIVATFKYCANDFVELLLIFIVCGIILPTCIGFFLKEDNYFKLKLIISILLHGIIFLAMYIWHSDNQREREYLEKEEAMLEERIQRDEQQKEDEQIEQESDSIRNEKIKFYSEKVKKELGNKIFGKFYFGMSRNQYNRELQNVKKELGGIIKIAGYDFHIGYPAFVDNKLYKIYLNTEIKQRESIEGTYEYSDEGYYSKMAQDITSVLNERYGDNLYVGKRGYYEDEWDLETIRIKAKIGYLKTTYSQGQMKIEDWGAIIEYTNPQLEQLVTEQEEKRKAEELRKVNEQEMKQKELEDKQSRYF